MQSHIFITVITYSAFLSVDCGRPVPYLDHLKKQIFNIFNACKEYHKLPISFYPQNTHRTPVELDKSNVKEIVRFSDDTGLEEKIIDSSIRKVELISKEDKLEIDKVDKTKYNLSGATSNDDTKKDTVSSSLIATTVHRNKKNANTNIRIIVNSETVVTLKNNYFITSKTLQDTSRENKENTSDIKFKIEFGAEYLGVDDKENMYKDWKRFIKQLITQYKKSKDSINYSKQNHIKLLSTSNNYNNTAMRKQHNIGGKNTLKQSIVFSEPIISKYTYKQINHYQPNKFTHVKVEYPTVYPLEYIYDHVIKRVATKEKKRITINNYNKKHTRVNSSKLSTMIFSKTEHGKIPDNFVYIPPIININQ